MPNKADLRVIKKVQRKAAAWILRPKGLTYMDKLVSLDISPRLLYQEFQKILLFAKIMNSNVDIDWTKHMSRLDYGSTRKLQTRNFAARPLRLKKCEFDFWFRTCQLANLFKDYFKEDFLFDPNHKDKLLKVSKAFFRQIYRETNPWTWPLLCDCSSCKETETEKPNYHCISKR